MPTRRTSSTCPGTTRCTAGLQEYLRVNVPKVWNHLRTRYPGLVPGLGFLQRWDFANGMFRDVHA